MTSIMNTKLAFKLGLACLVALVPAQNVQAAAPLIVPLTMPAGPPVGPMGPAGTSAPVHIVGEHYAGGIVFYVTDGGQHGLIAAKADQSTGIQWFNGTSKITDTTGDGLGAGAMNTTMIVATQISDNQNGNFAAKVAADYRVQEDGVTAVHNRPITHPHQKRVMATGICRPKLS